MLRKRHKNKFPPRDEIVSALIKELRRRNNADALYWLVLLIEIDGHARGALYLLCNFAIEDCVGEPVFVLSSSLLMLRANDNLIHNCTTRMFDIIMATETKRFWETLEGRANELSYWETFDSVQRDIASINIKAIPEYALDVHTKRSSKKAVTKFSGTRVGRLNMVLNYRKVRKKKLRSQGDR